MDPFAVIEYDGVKHRTTTQEEAGQNPTWNESFQFKIYSVTDKIIFRCFDEDHIYNDKLGEHQIPVNYLDLSGSISTQWIKLKNKDKISAELQISTRFEMTKEDQT